MTTTGDPDPARVKRLIVVWLERACTWAHPVTLWYVPFVSLPLCPLARLSDRLDQRWGTGIWKAPVA